MKPANHEANWLGVFSVILSEVLAWGKLDRIYLFIRR